MIDSLSIDVDKLRWEYSDTKITVCKQMIIRDKDLNENIIFIRYVFNFKCKI